MSAQVRTMLTEEQPETTGTGIKRLRIQVPDAVLADLHDRLDRARFPDAIPGAGWAYGTELEHLQELSRYWREDYDWRQREVRLNRFDHFKAIIDGRPIHYIHQRSQHSEAPVLVMMHGWPGSFVEFDKVIEPLTDPLRHGGTIKDAFHVICPSLPGFGLSDPPLEPGWDLRRMAHSFVGLMDRLGYQTYALQGGDCGAIIAPHMADIAPDRVSAIHLNGVQVPPPPGFDLATASPEDREIVTWTTNRLKDETGYSAVHRTRPQTLAYALNDSPIGLLAWIVEKFRSWSWNKGDVETAFSKDEILDNVMIYWVTQTINASMRVYCESYRNTGTYGEFESPVAAPTGIAHYPGDPSRIPDSWSERLFPVIYRNHLSAGGHFAAYEQPHLFVDDLRAFFRCLREQAAGSECS